MKTRNFIIVLLSIAISSTLFGQETELNVWTPETVILYRGIDNPIMIQLGENKMDEIHITLCDEATLKEKDGAYCIFLPVNFKDNTVEMTVESKIIPDQKEFYKFKVSDIPTPDVFLARLDPEQMQYSKEEILDNLKFVITPPENFLYDLKYHINSYNFFFTRNGITNRITVQGDEISESLIEYIKSANEPSQKLSFSFEIEGPDGVIFTPGFSVNIFNGWDEE